MKRSHGEPATICVSRVLDEPEFTIMLQLFAASKACVMLVMTFAKLEAANIRRVAGDGVAVGTGVGVAVGAGVGDEVTKGVGEAVVTAVGVGVGAIDGAGDVVAVGVGEMIAVGEGVDEDLLLAEKSPL